MSGMAARPSSRSTPTCRTPSSPPTCSATCRGGAKRSPCSNHFARGGTRLPASSPRNLRHQARADECSVSPEAHAIRQGWNEVLDELEADLAADHELIEKAIIPSNPTAWQPPQHLGAIPIELRER